MEDLQRIASFAVFQYLSVLILIPEVIPLCFFVYYPAILYHVIVRNFQKKKS
jgi:hypothetical protein